MRTPQRRPEISVWPLALGAAFMTLAFVALAAARSAAVDAMRWVRHTNDVKLALAGARIALDEGDRTKAVALLARVRALTIDNPRQQERLDALDINASDVRMRLDQLASEEDTLLAFRDADAQRQRDRVVVALAVCALSSVVLVSLSIGLLRRDKRALARQMALLGSIVDSIGDAVVAIDHDHRFIVTNAAFRRVFARGVGHGRLAVDAANRQEAQNAEGAPLKLEEGPLARALAGESVDGLLMSIVRADGGAERSWLSASSRPVLDTHGAVQAAVAVLRDVTQERRDRALLERQAEELRMQSLVDDLTGLYNRRGFMLLGEQYARAAARSRRPFAIVFADLNGLKSINDTYGHEEGDRAIRRMGAILRATLRESDIVARLAGDEFVALLDGADEVIVGNVLARLQHQITVEQSRETKSYRLSVSIGSAFQSAGGSATIEALMTQADEIMYTHKTRSRRNG